MTVTNRTTFRSLFAGARRSMLAAGLLLGSAAQAAPLNLTLFDFPDIVSSFITVDYDAVSDAFTADGFALELDDDGSVPAEDILGGSFNLTATIDASGAMSAGGTLSIGGTVASLGFNSGTLLTGDLTALGFNNANDPLEFLFDVTGGDASALFGGGSFSGGIILSNSGFGGSWDSDFGTTTAVSDTGLVPVPAAVWLFGSGLIGLVGLGRRRRLA